MGMEAALCSPFYDNLLGKTGLAVLATETTMLTDCYP